MSRLLAITAVLASFAVAGCGGHSGDGSPAQEGSTSQETAQTSRQENTSRGASSRSAAGRRGSVVSVQGTSYGTIVSDGRGRALYLFTKEPSSKSACYGACAQAWPPFLTKGEPQAGHGAKSNLLGTTERGDGATQVTYRGHPLYYYEGDTKPGEVGCQNVEEFGGLWLVVAPSGDAIQS